MSLHQVVHIEFSAKDPSKAGDFYGSLFGWKIVKDEAMDYVMFDGGEGTQGGFPLIGENNPEGSVILYISTDDIEGMLAQVKELGGEIIRPRTEIPMTGWFALFKDPSGNLLGLYTPMPKE